MRAINRWRNWKPTDEKLDECPKPTLTKLTEHVSVSFVSSIPVRRQNILSDKASREIMLPAPAPANSPRPETLAQAELLPAEIRAWDDTFRAWTQDCCLFRERSWGIVSELYISQTEWAHDTDGPFLGERETFVAILQSLGFPIVTDGSEVYGLLLKQDVESAEAAPERQRNAVEQWLLSGLKDGPKAITDVDRAGRAMGHPRAQIFDAAETLQLTKARIHDRLHWCSGLLDSNK